MSKPPKVKVLLDRGAFNQEMAEVLAFADFSQRVLELREALLALLDGDGKVASVEVKSTTWAEIRAELELSDGWAAFFSALRTSDFYPLVIAWEEAK